MEKISTIHHKDGEKTKTIRSMINIKKQGEEEMIKNLIKNGSPKLPIHSTLTAQSFNTLLNRALTMKL
jgi:hypothetical protein